MTTKQKIAPNANNKMVIIIKVERKIWQYKCGVRESDLCVITEMVVRFCIQSDMLVVQMYIGEWCVMITIYHVDREFLRQLISVVNGASVCLLLVFSRALLISAISDNSTHITPTVIYYVETKHCDEQFNILPL